jgi:hypothetical protein
MTGIKKIIKEFDENGNEVEIEVTEYPDIPVIVVEADDDNSK